MISAIGQVEADEDSKKMNLASSALRKKTPDVVKFRPIKESQILKEGPPTMTYSKTSYSEHHELMYKVLKANVKMVRSVLEANNFVHTDGHDWNVLWTCTSCKPYLYEGLNEHQKINHFPQSSELTRKDRLCDNVISMQDKFGKEPFDILPETYVLPNEFADFYSQFHELKNHGQNHWIIKPAAASRGRGIQIIDDISDLPIKESCIISRYIPNPLLVNGLKFDLRIYVLVTSYDPLRIYVYNEGLTRFASEPYRNEAGESAHMSNKFAHLTNYSINKKHEKFQNNEAADRDDQGNKWSLSALSKHLENIGADMNLFWSRIYDLIIKSLLCVQPRVVTAQKKISSSKNNCFELYGYDIMVDDNLSPWILEVNLSPSLSADSPLDMNIKSGLVSDMFNLIGVKKFDRRRDNLTKMKTRFKTTFKNKSSGQRSQSNVKSHNISQVETSTFGSSQSKKEGQLKDVKEMLSQKGVNVKHLKETLLEDQRKGGFIRIYPVKGSSIYDQYLQTSKQTTTNVYKYLFTDEILQVKQPANFPDSQYQVLSPVSSAKIATTPSKFKQQLAAVGAS